LFDGRGTLHLLVPQDDAHPDRTIGLLLDQYRTDAGADPPTTQIHRYRDVSSARVVQVTSEQTGPTASVRAAHGYLRMRVDDTAGLAGFLSRTRHLSMLEVQNGGIWADGWRWPDVPAVAVDPADVAVLQGAYQQSGSRPGFSLDPHPLHGKADVRALFPDLSPELADRLATGAWNGSAYGSAAGLAARVRDLLFRKAAASDAGLPADRVQLWGLLRALEGGPVFSQARYEGGLQGTEVGMTLFYTDYLTKAWVAGVGSGVPAQAVGGFVPDPAATIPWSHCVKAAGRVSESGRLWFGQNDGAFNFGDDRVSLGAQATRLFARSNGSAGTEVEPSFAAGRGLQWWDRHFQAVADYEPQYERLDQLMSWSGAIEWLVAKTPARLPQVEGTEVRSDLRFSAWYAAHGQLRERSPLRSVTPSSAVGEAVVPVPSRTYQQCGLVTISGGVSLSDRLRRQGDRPVRVDLPGRRRAGQYEGGTDVDPTSGQAVHAGVARPGGQGR
jgi:hypothetical protein